MHLVIYVLPHSSGGVFFIVCACLLSGLNITEENEQLGYNMGYQKLEFGAQGVGKFQLDE